MKKTKVSDIRSVDVLNGIPPQLVTSPVTTSSIRPEFLTYQGKYDKERKSVETKSSLKTKKTIDKLTPDSTVRPDEFARTSRDPNGINKHIQIHFEDVIGEPSDVQSITYCWRCASCCYTSWKNVVYKLFTLFTAFPNAALYGCWFGLNAFTLVWILTPFSHACHMCCEHCISKLVRLWASCAIGIPCRAAGQIFWVFDKKVKKLPKGQGRLPRVTFSDKVRTKRIPRNPENKQTESQMRLLFSRSPWQRRLF